MPTDQRRPERAVLLVVAAGGVLGSLARYQVGLGWPTAADAFPWATLGINVVGCLLIGVLLVLVTERDAVHRLWRPFLGTGVLGGFTTFSTYAVDVHRLIADRHLAAALSYLLVTAVAAIGAAAVGIGLTRRLVGGCR